MKRIIPVFAALLLMTGCIFSSRKYVPHSTYDLGTDVPECGCAVNLLKVSNESGADRRFLCRGESNRMSTDEYSFWMLEPELLIRRALRAAFAVRDSKAADIRCIIDRFEFDTVKNEAVLKLSVSISGKGMETGFVCSFKEKFSSGSSASAAGAMNKCVKSALEKICSEYRAFSKRTGK
jgi:hypothetical protein